MGNHCCKSSDDNINNYKYDIAYKTEITDEKAFPEDEKNSERNVIINKHFEKKFTTNPDSHAKVTKINEKYLIENIMKIKLSQLQETCVEIEQSQILEKNENTIGPCEKIALPIKEMPKIEYEVKGAVKLSPYEFNEDITCYSGEWKFGQRNGKGQQNCQGNCFYEGYFLNDLANGYGRFIFSSEEYYVGEWKNNKAEGMGEYFFNDEIRERFTGNWKNGVMHGKGELILLDKRKLIGTWVSGKLEGFVEIIYNDGGKFEGFFKENQINGKGVQKWGDKREYNGDFRSNELHGKGEFIWPSLNKYVGRYEDDKKNGYGEFYWNDGRKYLGIC